MNRKHALAAIAFCVAPLAAGAAQAAPDWRTLTQDATTQTWVDGDSIAHSGPMLEVLVLVNFAATRTVGDDWYPHRSRLVRYRIACDTGEAVASAWTFRAGELGTGASVWRVRDPSASPTAIAGGTLEDDLVKALCPYPPSAASDRARAALR